jgi:hypothetical protein
LVWEAAGLGGLRNLTLSFAPLPDGREAARAIGLALEEASLLPEDVNYVNAHASATPIGDRAEACAIRCALGTEVPVSGKQEEEIVSAAVMLAHFEDSLFARNIVAAMTVDKYEPKEAVLNKILEETA